MEELEFGGKTFRVSMAYSPLHKDSDSLIWDQVRARVMVTVRCRGGAGECIYAAKFTKTIFIFGVAVRGGGLRMIVFESALFHAYVYACMCGWSYGHARAFKVVCLHMYAYVSFVVVACVCVRAYVRAHEHVCLYG